MIRERELSWNALILTKSPNTTIQIHENTACYVCVCVCVAGRFEVMK